MAGEVTKEQQKLPIAAEDPPVFLGAGTHRPGREKAEVQAEINKFDSSQHSKQEAENFPEKAASWTQVRWKAKVTQKAQEQR